MNFSTNQVNQFYVYDGAHHNMVAKPSKDGKSFFFTYKGATGDIKTDNIELSKILYKNAVAAEKMQTPMKKFTISFDAAVNGGNPVVGQTYTVNIKITPYQGFGDEDYAIRSYSVLARTADATELMEELAGVINDSLKTDKYVGELFKVAPSAATLVITTLPQTKFWVRGESQLEFVNLEISVNEVKVDGVELTWAADTSFKPAADSVKVKNGYTIADLEYFCMGERGDQYRNAGMPNIIRTKYLVDETAEYDVLTIHYYFDDSLDCVEKSEKDITIVGKAGSLDTLITAVNKAVPGLELPKVAPELP